MKKRKTKSFCAEMKRVRQLRSRLVAAETAYMKAICVAFRPGTLIRWPHGDIFRYGRVVRVFAMAPSRVLLQIISEASGIQVAIRYSAGVEAHGRVCACQECGCTDDDCRQCIEKTGTPCHWIRKGLCSACAGNRDE